MEKIYLAGPHGFSEISVKGVAQLKNILIRKFEIIDPFQYKPNQELGRKIKLLSDKFYNTEVTTPNKSYPPVISQMKEINVKIALNNENLLRSADKVFAILDGSDVDSGTAAEIGMAYILGKEIYGYRGDFRLSSDNIASIINLQVEYCINRSNGKIFRSLSEVSDWINEST